MFWALLAAFLGIAGATGTALYLGNKANKKAKKERGTLDNQNEENEEEIERNRKKKKRKENQEEQEEEEEQNKKKKKKKKPVKGKGQAEEEEEEEEQDPEKKKKPGNGEGGSEEEEEQDPEKKKKPGNGQGESEEEEEQDPEKKKNPGNGEGESEEEEIEEMDPFEDLQEDKKMSANEAKKEILRYNQKLRSTYNSKAGHDLVDEKVKSMETIDIENHSASEKKIHYDAMVSVVDQMWKRNLEISERKTTELLQRLSDGEDPSEVMKDMPEAYTFGDFVSNSDDIILETHQKYEYYHYEIREKANEVISKMDNDDPRVQEIIEICNRCAKAISNINQRPEDYEKHVERDLLIIEDIEREVNQSLDEKKKAKAVKTLNAYKEGVLRDWANNGRTLDELVDLTLTKLAKNGEITIDNPEVKAQLTSNLKAEWIRKATESARLVDGLISELEKTTDYDEVLSKIPSLKMHTWFNDQECKDFVVSSYNEYMDKKRSEEPQKKKVKVKKVKLKDKRKTIRLEEAPSSEENRGPEREVEPQKKKASVVKRVKLQQNSNFREESPSNIEEVKKPNVSVQDVFKYSNAGGMEGYDHKNNAKLSEAEHCYAQFLHNVERAVLRAAEKSGKSLSERSLPEMRGFIEGATFKYVSECAKKYAIDPEKLKDTGTYEVPQMPFARSDLYAIQYFLMLNGFEIDLGKMTKDITKNDLKLNKNGKIVLPVKFTGRKLNETKVKEYWDSKGIKGESQLADVVRKKMEQEKVVANQNSGR